MATKKTAAQQARMDRNNARIRSSQAKKGVSAERQAAADASALSSMNTVRASQGLDAQPSVGVSGSNRVGQNSTIVGNDVVSKTGQVLGTGKDKQDALALQNQLAGGSTPTLSGRPDLLARNPLTTEKVESFNDSALGGITINPRVATDAERASQQAGTLQNYPKSQGLTYLDGATFRMLQNNLTEDDLVRQGEQIYLKQGLTPDQVMARNTAVPSAPVVPVEDITIDFSGEIDSTTLDEAITDPKTDEDINKLIEEQQKLQEAYLAELAPNENEQALKEELVQLRDEIRDYKASLQAGLDEVEDQTIPMAFITGQQASMERRANRALQTYADEEANLLDYIGLEQEARQMRLTTKAAAIQFFQDNVNLAFQIQDRIDAKAEAAFQRARELQSDSRATLTTMLDSLQGYDRSDMSDAAWLELQQMAVSAGIPTSLLEESLSATKAQLQAEELGITQQYSLAQTLISNGIASSLEQALGMINGTSSTTYSPTEDIDTTFMTEDGMFDIDTYASAVGNGTVVEGSPYHTDNGNGGTYEIDIDGKIGDPVVAPVSGTVVSAGEAGGFGNSVVIQDASGNLWRLAHFDSLSVQEGQSITSGAVVGRLGNTGSVIGENGGDGSHLHMEVKDSAGNYVDFSSMKVLADDSSDETTAINQAVDNLAAFIPKDRMNAIRSNVNQSLESGDVESAVETLQSAVLSSVPADQQNKAYGRYQALIALSAIEESLAEYVENNGDTNLLEGKAENLQEAVLKSTSDPELAEIANSISLAIIAYRSAVSGAAFTETELKQYNSIFPSTGNTPELNASKISSLRESFYNNQRGVMEPIIGSSNYEILFGALAEPVDAMTNATGFKQKGEVDSGSWLESFVDYLIGG